MRSKFFAAAAALLTAAAVFAFVGGGKDEHKGAPKGADGFDVRHGGPLGGDNLGMFDMLEKDLGLSEAQVKQIFDINQKYKAQHFAQRKTKDEAKVKALFDGEQAEIKAVLTAEQQTKFEELMKSPPAKCGNVDEN